MQKNNVPYEALIMLDMDSAEERRRLNVHAKFKAQVYASIKESPLFIESDPNQAQEIAQLSGKDVFCVGNAITFRGGIP